ncbi:hypothetical protein [Xylanimonas ulmi]|uniref:Uncharacterized protein n=1 Tax=Xylanimonas ulmi TaxID=228973 RepID=A0A4Q7M2M2_9MICO|nr:hypothetical protein [Xylanibacterium ulmi]RZS61213.1 hypothetical protein EV386_1504 [Xylanibacterium ulmi]
MTVTSHRGCAPEQWTGDINGRRFHFRERWGEWTLDLDIVRVPALRLAGVDDDGVGVYDDTATDTQGQLDDGGRLSTRRSAWLARAALEDILLSLVLARGVDPGRSASASATLTCIESLYCKVDPGLAASAQYAWHRLSEACHQHAYELEPAHGEIAHLIDHVDRLAARLAAV